MSTGMRYTVACVIAVLVSSVIRADETSPNTAPTTITMHMTSVHPRDALAEFTKQTDVPLQIWPEQLYEQHRGMGNRLGSA